MSPCTAPRGEHTRPRQATEAARSRVGGMELEGSRETGSCGVPGKEIGPT